MYVLAISHGKGGVAKTTTAVSLATGLTERSQRVLLVDMDPQATLSLLVGVDPERQPLTLGHVLFDKMPVARAIQSSIVTGLDVISSGYEMSLAEQFLPTRSNFQYILRSRLREVNPVYDYVILDCSPFLGSITLNALVASNLVIIPTSPEMLSITGMRYALNWISQVKKNYNPFLTYRILITMFNKNNKVHLQVSEKLRERMGQDLFETVIGVDAKLRESHIVGKPVMLHAPKSRSSLQYRSLAEEVINYVEGS